MTVTGLPFPLKAKGKVREVFDLGEHYLIVATDRLSAFDVVMPCSSLYHATAWGLPFIAPINGCKIVLPAEKMDGASLQELILGEGVTFSGGVPTIWTMYLAHLDQTGGSGTLQVSCNPSVRAFTVSINGGSNDANGVRRLRNGSELIPYQLAADPSGAVRYGIGQQRNFSISSAAQIPIPIYGAVVAHPRALPAGIYRDTLMVTLDW